MRVKRYVVDTMPEAMRQIRGDLGTDAVILSTKEMKTGGFMGMFRKKKIEVLAAVEKEEEKPKPQWISPRNVEPEQQGTPLQAVIPKGTVPQAYLRSAQSMNSQEDTISRQESLSLTKRPHHDDTEVAASIQSPFPDKEKTSVEHGALLDEIREMKAMMTKISRSSTNDPVLPEGLQQMCDRLLEQEIDQHLLDEWLEKVFQQRDENVTAISSFDLEQALRDEIRASVETRLGGGILSTTKIVYVAGPTGVGKTTTIAKLAAEQLFRHRRKVGFITSDTYRISAVEQLRTYAAILNVPLEVVQSPGDMQRAVQRLEDCDLILMDTAGRNYRNELLVSELQSLLSPTKESETYLVLSLTSKGKDMKAITEHFSKFGLGKVIFTKMDETGSYGAMFNLLHTYPLALSYMTNGQNVPDDLLLPDTDTLMELLLGELV